MAALAGAHQRWQPAVSGVKPFAFVKHDFRCRPYGALITLERIRATIMWAIVALWYAIVFKFEMSPVTVL